MRHLLQPRVLNQAALAAGLSALACYPRMTFWQNRSAPVWYLEATIFLCAIVLWGFVFAWHTPYTGRPVLAFKLEPRSFFTVTLTGLLAAAVYHLWLDPPLRAQLPEEYPADARHWLAALLFTLGLNQLFLTFALCDWLLRLLKRPWLVAVLAALFGAGLLVLKLESLATPLPTPLLVGLLTGRIAAGFLAVIFYLRGGVVLVCWWNFLFESRHLLNLTG